MLSGRRKNLPRNPSDFDHKIYAIPSPSPPPPTLLPGTRDGALSQCELHQDDGHRRENKLPSTLWSSRHGAIPAAYSRTWLSSYGIANEVQCPAMSKPQQSSWNQRLRKIAAVKTSRDKWTDCPTRICVLRHVQSRSQIEEVAKNPRTESAIFTTRGFRFTLWSCTFNNGCLIRAALNQCRCSWFSLSCVYWVFQPTQMGPARSWLTVYNLISLDDYTEKLMMTMTKGEDQIGFELQPIDNMYFLSSSSTKP